MLNGKLIFYEKGMIFVDARFHAIVMPYELIKEMTIHQEKDDWWFRINLEDVEGSSLKVKNLVPHNLTVDTS